jgi:hypothetical protein
MLKPHGHSEWRGGRRDKRAAGIQDTTAPADVRPVTPMWVAARFPDRTSGPVRQVLPAGLSRDVSWARPESQLSSRSFLLANFLTVIFQATLLASQPSTLYHRVCRDPATVPGAEPIRSQRRLLRHERGQAKGHDI